jgi:alpha-tubulin suppressor-like RCC1 family protein
MRPIRLIPLVTLAVLAAACGDRPAITDPTPVAHEPPAAAPPLGSLTCRGDAHALTLDCGLSSGIRAAVVTLGGQHRFVRLRSGPVSYDAATDRLTASVDVQNLLQVAMGTADGTTPDASGIRVFFETPPSGGVTVANPAGTGTFTASGQPYFTYAGTQLGADKVLSPGEASAAQTWQFAMNGAASFVFTVYVQAAVPSRSGAYLYLASVAPGGSHACGLTAAGQAYCWGQGTYGQLGDGLGTLHLVPTPVAQPAGVAFASLSAGLRHTCGVTTAGQVMCWGFNQFGELGDGSGQDHLSPVFAATPAGVKFKAVSVGQGHTCALSEAGTAYCWGSNGYGQLGDGTNVMRTTPVPVAGSLIFDALDAGVGHTCAVTPAGAAYCWGEDDTGELGDNGFANQWSPVAVAGQHLFSSISAGSYHTCALGRDGTPYCWGYNAWKQLGDGTTTQRTAPVAVVLPAGVTLTAITAGQSHTCGLAADGTAYCWGYGAQGQLGSGSAPSGGSAPTLVAAGPGAAYSSVVAGMDYGCATLAGGGVQCWGSNVYGQLGDETQTQRNAPVFVAATR